jgi:hypothetical protein
LTTSAVDIGLLGIGWGSPADATGRPSKSKQ